MLVDLEPKPMACPMKESNSPAFAHLRRKTTLCEEFLNCFMNRHPIDSRLDLLQSKRLPGFHCLPTSSLRLARAPAQHGTSHVTELPGLRVPARKVRSSHKHGFYSWRVPRRSEAENWPERLSILHRVFAENGRALSHRVASSLIFPALRARAR